MILYGAYHVSTEYRTCLGTQHKVLLLAHHDVSYVRDTINQHFSTSSARMKYGTIIQIPQDHFKSNEWCNGLGGAQSTGYIIIEKLPTSLEHLNECN